MTVIDGACDKQTQSAFHQSRFTEVRLRAVITLQTVWWEKAGRSRSRSIYW